MPELKKATVTPQPVRQDILLPDAFPALPKSMRDRFGKDAEEFDELSRRWWSRTKRVLSDAHFEVAQPQNAIKEDTRNIRKEFVSADAVITAGFSESIEVLITDTSALVLRTTELESKVDTPITGLLARITYVESTYATEGFASAKKSEAIAAAAAAATTYTDGRISSLSSVYATPGSVTALVSEAVTASIGSAAAGSIGAAIATERDARATADGHFSGKYSMNVAVAGPVINSGVLVVGRAYQITAEGGDLTAVGAAANTVGVRFVATATEPTWSGGAVRQLIVTGMNVSSNTGAGVNTNEISFQSDKFSLQTSSGTPIRLLDVTEAGGFVFGADLFSNNYVASSAGWTLTRAGRFEAQAGNIAGFEIGPSSLYASSVGGWGTRWFAVNTNFGLTPYMEVGSESGSARLDAVRVAGKKGGFDLWAIDEGFGGGVLRLWNGSGSANIIAKGSDGSFNCGAVTATSVSAGSYNVSSSRRFKDNIRPIQDALATLLQLRGVRFDWNTKVLPGDIGFIAEEVDQVLPTLVGRDANGGVIGVDYGRTTALLVEAVKELANRINAIRV